jgi:hypothetical protein
MNDTPIQSPVGDRRLPDRSRAALRTLLVEHVATSAPVARGLATKRVVIPIAAGVALVGFGGGIAYSQLGGDAAVTDQHTARCYSVATYVSGDDFPGTTLGVPDSAAGPGSVADALDACSALWRAGILQPGSDTAVVSPSQAQYPVPNLVECVLPDGRAAVFPGNSGLCSELGLQAAQTGTGR